MGIIDRIILTIYTFVLAFLSLGVVLLGLSLLPLEWVWTSVHYIYGQWEAALVAAVFLLVSVRLLLAGVRSRGERETIVHHGDMGDIHIALDAVKNLMEKTARHVRGVRGVKVRVSQSGKGLAVFIRAVISPESNVPDVSAQIQERVYAYAKNTVGVELADVKILVENIANDFKKQRVE
ncbi:alkaline shock response membrane anchor protein AmaP [Sporolituus thermophilus]|uniref:Uncharacterized conserved protein YloU, alkaline shock protein (Asp23) family n=1 Tax=Sporolituus thermophilus DSM 23256 TaxID=1123285 RepID=A0A1G7IBV9_9FIRM|nr:alkaline shock response membrane anchor protein AmaP [Sporolituus thermophilus]SDF09984.1 Uncharacterized conserved protein YloU, alkaline shock protein (Asp23) family [Sporolituus thermophilus DSM 23256]